MRTPSTSTSPRTLPSVHEREHERATLIDAARSAADGHGRLVIVTARGGIGKTRLLGVAAEIASDAGLTVLRATASELERELPFGVAITLLGAGLAGSRNRDAVTSGAARLGAQLALGAESLNALGGGEPALMTLIHSLYWVTVNLSEDRPLALLVDDAHWADPATVRLLAYIARRVADLPLLLVVAIRPHQSESTGASLETLEGATRLDLEPLSEEATIGLLEELLGAPPERAFATACAHVTRGNPLLLRELVRAVRDEGATGSASDVQLVSTIGPSPVIATVRRALARLPDGATMLVHALSVMHEPANVAAAIELSGLEPAVARRALGELERAEIVATGDGVRIHHPLVRRAIAASIPAGELVALHLQAAELHARRQEHERAAAHLLRVPPSAQRWAVDALLAAAGQALERAAAPRAVELLERALAEPPVADQRPELLATLARARAVAGDSGAKEAFRAAIDERHGEEAAALLLELAVNEQSTGHFAEAIAAATEGLARAQPGTALSVDLTVVRNSARVWSTGIDHVTAERPGTGDDDPPAIDARTERAIRSAASWRAMFEAGDCSHAAALALSAWDDGALLLDAPPEDARIVRPAAVLQSADRLTDALAICDACLHDAARRGSPLARATWVHLRGQTLLYMGALLEGEADLSLAFAARRDGWGAYLPYTAQMLVDVYLERGELATARDVIAQARASGVHADTSPMWASVECALARVLLAEGRSEEALRHAETARDVARRVGSRNPAALPWAPYLVAALRRLGRVDEAIAIADDELSHARTWGAPRTLARTLRARAALADAADERRALLREALEAVTLSEARLEHAHCAFALGRLDRQQNKPGARQLLRLALELAERCSATVLMRQVAGELREAGARPRRSRATGPDSLTPAERRVAERAALGQTSRAIAEELFVTPKAVAFHLGNVYKKLGISGRGELRAALAREA